MVAVIFIILRKFIPSGNHIKFRISITIIIEEYSTKAICLIILFPWLASRVLKFSIGCLCVQHRRLTRCTTDKEIIKPITVYIGDCETRAEVAVLFREQ